MLRGTQESSEAVDIVQQKSRSNSFNAPTPANTPLNPAPINSYKAPKSGALSLATSNRMDEKNNPSSLLAQNPALLDALQQRFGQLLGKSSGYIESLPEEVKKQISLLEDLQNQRAHLESEFRSEMLELEKKYLGLAQPLYLKRAEIIAGNMNPQKNDNLNNETANGIPEFWLTCFKNSPILEELIQEKDEPALVKLRDVRLSYLENNPGFKLDFVFDENDFFANNILSKTYYLQDDPSEHKDVMFDHAEGTEINWKEGKNLSVRVETRKQRHKTSNKTRIVKKTVACETFFNFFAPPAIPEDDEEDIDEDLDKKLEEDYEIGEFFKEELIPRAVDWFTGKAAMELADDYDDFEEEEEEYEEGEEGQEDSDEDEDGDVDESGVADSAQQKPECKQQ